MLKQLPKQAGAMPAMKRKSTAGGFGTPAKVTHVKGVAAPGFDKYRTGTKATKP